MKKERTLPDLENDLFALVPGDLVALSRSDFIRIFGLNDAAKGRLTNFARLHNRSTVWTGDTLVFCKRPPTWDGLPDRPTTN